MPVSCGEYEVRDKAGRVAGTVVFDDAFAQGFSSMRRIRSLPCPGAPAVPGLWARVRSWIRAEASRVVQGELAPEAVESRLTVCRQCTHLVRHEADDVGFCGACGCGTRQRARLTIKAKMPGAVCPLGNWAHLPPHGDSK